MAKGADAQQNVVVRPVLDGEPWPDVVLEHGEAPELAAVRAVREAGGPPVVVVRPRTVDRRADDSDGALVIELEVRRTSDASPPTSPLLAPTPPAEAPPDEVPGEAAPTEAVRFRRVGAYALVLDHDRILLTQLSDNTSAAGTWTLPGGGIDDGESPVDAVLREVHEETAHVLVSPRLLEVDSVHFTGRSPSGRLEDFHGIAIHYLATVVRVGKPRVLDVGGSTSDARWVPLDELSELPLTPRSRARISRVLSLATSYRGHSH